MEGQIKEGSSQSCAGSSFLLKKNNKMGGYGMVWYGMGAHLLKKKVIVLIFI